MANDAEGQEKQRDNLIQKAHILSFQSPTASFAIQQGDFSTTRPSRAKGPFQRSHIIARSVFGGKTSVTLQFLFCQEIVCPPAFFIKKTEHMQVSNKVLRINKGKKTLSQLSYCLLTLKAKSRFALDNPGKSQLKLLV